MQIKILDIDMRGCAYYKVDNWQTKYYLKLTIKMIKEANEGFTGSYSQAKLEQHIKPTIQKFHKHHQKSKYIHD